MWYSFQSFIFGLTGWLVLLLILLSSLAFPLVLIQCCLVRNPYTYQMPSLIIQIVTLFGSLLSVIGSGLMIICCILLPITGTFRHQLICSLAISDFIYSLNNTISGFILVTSGTLHDGTLCTVNGYIYHYASLVRDLTVLGIALVTYGVLKGPLDSADYKPYLPRHPIAVFIFIWLAPNIPTLVGYKSSGFTLASGNWCGAPSDPAWVRGVLFLGIPFVVTISIVILYTYLYSSLRLYYISTRQPHTGFFDAAGEHFDGIPGLESMNDSHDGEQIHKSIMLSDCIRNSFDDLNIVNLSTKELSPRMGEDLNGIPLKQDDGDRYKPDFLCPDKDHIAMAMRRMYLYPLVYVAITFPGLLNRLLETIGVDSDIFEVLQSITQLTGLANAVLYGFTGTVRRALYEKYVRTLVT